MQDSTTWVGIELELAVLLLITWLGQTVFARFEIETAMWRKLLKWFLIYTLTLAGYAALGHWILVLPVLAASAGMMFHFVWCKRHGIDPLTAQPLERYYALRGWSWPPGR